MSTPNNVKVGDSVWVLVLEHPYGMGVRTYTTWQAAKQARQGLAADSWDAEMPGNLPRPEDPADLADAYFEEMGDYGQYATIYETTLRGD